MTVGRPEALKTFPLVTSTLDPQSRIRREGDRLVAGEVEHLAGDIDEFRVDQSRA